IWIAKSRHTSLWHTILRAPRKRNLVDHRVNADSLQALTIDPARGSITVGTLRTRAYQAIAPFSTMLAPSATNRSTASGRCASKRPMKRKKRTADRAIREGRGGGGLRA